MCVWGCQRVAAPMGAYTASYGRLNHLGFTIRMGVGSSPGSEKAKLGRRGNTAADRRALKLDILGLLAARPLQSLASHFASQHASRGRTEARTSTQIGLLTVCHLPHICSSLWCGHALGVTTVCTLRVAGVGETPQSLSVLPICTRRCVDFYLNLLRMYVIIRSSEIKRLDYGFASCVPCDRTLSLSFLCKGGREYLPSVDCHSIVV